MRFYFSVYFSKVSFYANQLLVLSLLGMSLALPTQAFAYCFERFYTAEHLQKHPQQVVKSIVFDLQDEPSDDDLERAKANLQIRMMQKAKPTLVAAVKARCEFVPNTGRSQGSCQILAPGQGAFTFKGDAGWLFDSKSLTVKLSEDSVFENLTYQENPGHPNPVLVKVPKYDHSMRVDKNEMVSIIKGSCEPVIIKTGTVNAARFWNEVILYSVRNDLARPTVTARNLYHLSTLMWDVYTSFDQTPNPLVFSAQPPITRNLLQARDVAMAYAAVTFLKERYKNAPVNTGDQHPALDMDMGDGQPDMFLNFTYDRVLKHLDYDLSVYQKFADFGRALAENHLAVHMFDGARETDNYRPAPGFVYKNNLIADISQSGLRLPSVIDSGTMISDFYSFMSSLGEEMDYSRVPLAFDTTQYRGDDISRTMDINHWLRLNIPGAIDQGGTATASEQSPLTLFLGDVKTFSDLSAFKSKDKPGVYFDPGDRLPRFETNPEEFIRANLQVIEYSSMLNPIDTYGYDWDQDGVRDYNPGSEMMDISPQALGNNALGTNNGRGHQINPYTGERYQPYYVKKADYYRSIAEFWADGPESETPPGHWNSMANFVLDGMKKKSIPYKWQGPTLDDQLYSLKMYVTLNGALHDAAIAAWGLKGHYQGNRPVTVIRKLAQMAEADPVFAQKLVSMSPNLKMVTYTKESPKDIQGRTTKQTVTKLAVKAWRGASLGQFYQSEGPGPEMRDMSFRFRNEMSTEEDAFYSGRLVAGVGWILADNWTPYQRQTFVTPPFPGFVSGHSTFSRAAAEVLAGVTGSPFFPGGIGRYQAPDLHFEYDDNQAFEFQWATYYDAADVSGLSRIYGGIHATYDDLPAREIGSKVGLEALKTSNRVFKR